MSPLSPIVTSAHAATVTFNTAAAVGSWTVPAGVTRIRISIRGADGGLASQSANGGGAGASGDVIFNVVPGDLVRYVIGEVGGPGDQESGGGGGTGVFINNTLVLAAGGGGGEDNTGNGFGGGASSNTTSNSGSAGGTAANGGIAGVGGAPGGPGNNGGIIAPVGDGGGGGGGINAAGVCFTGVVNITPPGGNGLICGGGRADNIVADGLTVSPGGVGSENSAISAGNDGLASQGGRGFGGGGSGGHRESGGGGGYSGGGGGGSGGWPGGGGSYVNNTYAGYVSGSIAAGANGGGTGASGSVTIGYTTLQLSKTSNNNIGTFNFTTNLSGYTPGSIITFDPATPTPGSISPVNATAAFTVTESAMPGGWALSSITCTGLGGGTSANTLGTRTVTITNAALVPGNDIVCAFTNTYTGPALTILKTPNTLGPVVVGQVITYIYRVSNPSTVVINNVGVTDVHNGYGIDPVPGSPVRTDNAPLNDSPDTNPAANIWGTLAGGDYVTFTATYTVTQDDIDFLQ